MTVRVSPSDVSSLPRQRVEPAAGAGHRELDGVVERALRVDRGLALLQDGPLESAAVLLGVTPPAIERARAALAEPGALAGAVSRLAHATAGRRAVTPPARPAVPSDPAELIDAARRRAGGLSLLLSAAPEAAAIAFGVHPDLVHGARAAAAGRPDLRHG